MKNGKLYLINGTVEIIDVEVDMMSRTILTPYSDNCFQKVLHLDGKTYNVINGKF